MSKKTDPVARLIKAWNISEKVFGTANLFAAQEIANYLKEDIDEADFAADLGIAFNHAKEICKTMTPTPEQVFWVFDEVIVGDGE